MITIALGIPHLPGTEARDIAFLNLKDALLVEHKPHLPQHYREITDRKPQREWARDMWYWAISTGADFFLTLQDDVEPSPTFWPALRAMLGVLPKGAALGLSAVHPIGVEIASRGHRWYRTRSFLVGWAYGLWRDDLAALIEYEKTADPKRNEDDVVNDFITATGRDTWHPLPGIVDHDTSIPSTYAELGNDGHALRRLAVRWESFGDAITVPDFWKLLSPDPPPMVPNPQMRACWFCLLGVPCGISSTTGASICKVCLARVMLGTLGVRVGGPAT